LFDIKNAAGIVEAGLQQANNDYGLAEPLDNKLHTGCKNPECAQASGGTDSPGYG